MKSMTTPPEKRYTKSEIIDKIAVIFAAVIHHVPAPAIFALLVARGLITGSDEEGWVISPSVNLAAIAEELLAEIERNEKDPNPSPPPPPTPPPPPPPPPPTPRFGP